MSFRPSYETYYVVPKWTCFTLKRFAKWFPNREIFQGLEEPTVELPGKIFVICLGTIVDDRSPRGGHSLIIFDSKILVVPDVPEKTLI